MRRNRNLREHRNKQIAQRKVLTLAEQRRATQQRAMRRRKNRIVIDNTKRAKSKLEEETLVLLPDSPSAQEVHAKKVSRTRSGRSRIARRLNKNISRDWNSLPASQPSSFQILPTDQYIIPQEKIIKVCHVIDSLGLGGAQTMMVELVNALNSYYGENIQNYIVCASRKKQSGSDKLYGSYGVKPDSVVYEKFRDYLTSKKIDVVLHHRVAISRCLKNFIPSGIKYVLLNHTWHSMRKMSQFLDCDFYISVCKFLDRQTAWADFIHDSRKLVILNGVESKYIDDIEAKGQGKFNTGRCHRMVASKFRVDSLTWMQSKVVKTIPGFTHQFIGTNKQAKLCAQKYKWLKYHGTVLDRKKKIEILKGLDVYFYETFQDEGASIAILESLACGIPVLSKSLGGCPELVIDGKNGFLVKDRPQYLIRLQQLAEDENFLEALKQSTREDFEKRLHIRHTACKYLQLFNYLVEC